MHVLKYVDIPFYNECLNDLLVLQCKQRFLEYLCNIRMFRVENVCMYGTTFMHPV